jgi:hypothetical protein
MADIGRTTIEGLRRGEEQAYKSAWAARPDAGVVLRLVAAGAARKPR